MVCQRFLLARLPPIDEYSPRKTLLDATARELKQILLYLDNYQNFSKLTVFLQPEQNSFKQVGHCTEHGDIITIVGCRDIDFEAATGSTRHTVSQPARGHHVRFLSNSTSVNRK